MATCTPLHHCAVCWWALGLCAFPRSSSWTRRQNLIPCSAQDNPTRSIPTKPPLLDTHPHTTRPNKHPYCYHPALPRRRTRDPTREKCESIKPGTKNRTRNYRLACHTRNCCKQTFSTILWRPSKPVCDLSITPSNSLLSTQYYTRNST
jgi:hypothetical protein